MDIDVALEECQNCSKISYYGVRHGNDTDIIETYPPVEDDLDEALIDDVKVALREAYRSVDGKNWNACVTMCRRALEESTRALRASGGNLQDKIDDLEQSQRITPALKDWAHETRLGGNLGAHGSRIKKWADEQDAVEILEFTKWFMQYIYVLPAQLAARRSAMAQTP